MIPSQLREALAAPRAREFAFGDEDFEALSKLVKELTGINLCALGDSIEPFLKSVIVRFPEQFESRVAGTPQPVKIA